MATEPAGSSAAASAATEQGYQLPWTAIPKFIPGTTDVTEYTKKLQFLAAMWPKESMALLAPRAALLCEGSAFKKVASLSVEKLKSSDDSGVKLLVATLGGSWGRTDVEQKYDTFEKAIFGTTQKADETNDSYLARHDIHFEELVAQGVSLQEIRAYILLRQSSLTPDDRKRIVVELGGKLEYQKVCASIRLLGSRFFGELQGQRGSQKTKTYDANMVEDAGTEDTERALQAATLPPPEDPEIELDTEFVEALAAIEDPDALQVQAFEEELEGFFQETPELQEALVSYMEARNRLLAKRKARGFWPVSGGQKGGRSSKGFKGKGKGKSSRDQLLQRIAKSNCRACGERGHWKAECPKYGRPGSKAEATTTMAEAVATGTSGALGDEIHEQLPEEAVTLAEAMCAVTLHESRPKTQILSSLRTMVHNLKTRPKPKNPTSRPRVFGATPWTEPVKPSPKPAHTEGVHISEAFQASEKVEAILDTGASRCVVGRNLLPNLLGQLSDRVRSLVRVTKSAVKFRFGNNQTLVSDKRVLLPIRTIGHQILWLGLEVVPGSTPLLFSKRAIKQLGGIIDTNKDVCQFERLRKHVTLRTGATGLYLVDLARLCEESCTESDCQVAREEPQAQNHCGDPCMSVSSTSRFQSGLLPNLPKTFPSPYQSLNSKTRFRKYPEPDNVKPLVPEAKEGVQSSPPVEPLTDSNVSNEPAVTAPANSSEHRTSLTSVASHGSLVPRRFPKGLGNALPALGRSDLRVHTRSSERHGPGLTWPAPGDVRDQGPWTSLRRRDRDGAVVDQVVHRAPVRESQTRSSSLSALCGTLRTTGRSFGSRFGDANRDRKFQEDRGHSKTRPQEPRCSQAGASCTRGRSMVHAVGATIRSASRGASECALRTPESSGRNASAGCDASGLGASGSEPSLKAVESCKLELQALISQQPVDLSWIEEEAKSLVQASSDVSEYKKYLRRVPWHLLKGGKPKPRSITNAAPEESTKPAAYVMFGAFSHGGVTGATQVTRKFPWLTKVLTKTLQITQPEHQFTTVGVSCNTQVEPHRDSYNSRDVPNLVIPLDFPTSGGEIWIAQPPGPNQKTHVMTCNGQERPGSLVHLRGPMLLDPHTWHASMPSQGNRTLLIGYSLSAVAKFEASLLRELQSLGFPLPSVLGRHSSQTNFSTEDDAAPSTCSCLRQELQSASSLLLDSTLHQAAQEAEKACVNAFCKAQSASWDVYQDSMLVYQQPTEPQLDVLEIYSHADSRLTDIVNQLGGRAQRFTISNGDLATSEGQRALWDVIQRTQPRHIWASPDCRIWSSWTRLNAARSQSYQRQLYLDRSQNQIQWSLCAKLCRWQKQNHRDFHLELPISTSLDKEEALKEVRREVQQIYVDMCAFGLRTPTSLRPIKKPTRIWSTSSSFLRSLVEKQCPGHHQHQPVAGRLRELGGQTLSRYAGTYCRGFAEHCAQQLLQRKDESVYALDASPPMTRKRFKTSIGNPSARFTQRAQKRAAAVPQESDSRDQVRRRVATASAESSAPAAQSAESSALPASQWKPIFEMAARCHNKATPILIPPQHEIIASLSLAMPEYQILQVFVGVGSKMLHHPLGALPATVAPVRITLASYPDRGGEGDFRRLFIDQRASMSREQSRLRITPALVLLTVFAQLKPAVPETRESQSTTALPSSAPAQPDIEAWAPPPVPLHGPAFRSLSSADKAKLRRIHANLGHPAPETLARHLKAAQEAPELIEAALDFQCDVCLESTYPRHQRPSKLPEPKEFNDLIGVDGFYFKSKSGYRAYAIHALDEASCFQQARRAPSRLGTHAMQALNEFWISWAGPPKQVYLDPAGEFRSEQILEFFQEHNTKIFVTAAAWQRGRLERHGDILKEMLARMDSENPIVNDSSFDQALLQAILAKNALVRHSGFSPEQIVFGKSLRVPGSVASDEDLTAHALSEGADLESEMYRQKLDLRCRARRAFMDADNSQAIRRATLRRSNPIRGPFTAGMWVLYWVKKSSPNRLAAGRWHGPAKVVCSEGTSVVWLAHGTNIIRSAPENIRPASLREWQQLTDSQLTEPLRNVGGASSFIDLTGASAAEPSSSTLPTDPAVIIPQSNTVPTVAPATENPPDEVNQPEQELTPQVSQEAPAVEREVSQSFAAPPEIPALPSNAPADAGNLSPNPQDVPIPESDDGLLFESTYLASEETGIQDAFGNELLNFTTVQSSTSSQGPPLAEDDLPFVSDPLQHAEHQAFCLEVPLRSKDVRKWLQEKVPEQLATVAAAGKRARAEVCLKDLSPKEVSLFEVAKEKEISCWIQTSAIRAILRRKLNPEQILKSRWILTWKPPEEGQSHPKAKARLVVLGFQDPKLVEVMRDAPTLSREGRALVLQTIASRKFRLGSFDIKTAFLRGKADENNPLAMDPPKELRKALNLKDDEVCELLGNAYGRVDAPLLFYKELSKQLLKLGFVRHPLEPCVFMLYTQDHLHGILGMHVDDGVCGGDKLFLQKIEALQQTLPFGSRKQDKFTFTGIQLEQLADFSIRASQSDYVHNIHPIDIGRSRRQTPEVEVTEVEKSKLRGLVGSLQYAVTHTRPDIAAKLGEVQGAISRATIQTLLQANKVLREAQEQAHVSVTFLPIQPDRLTFVAFGDASFASSRNLNSHQGALICATDDRLLMNTEAPLSPLTWSSKKIPRVVRSTLSAEAYAMSKAVDMLGWMRALWGTVHVAGFQWQHPETSGSQLNKAIIITDCKSVYDLVTRLAMPSCEEFRTTLEILLIKQRCGENIAFRWVPTTLQAADCLTKPMDATVLRTILAQSRFKLYDASQALQKNAQRKEAVEWLSQSPQTSLL